MKKIVSIFLTMLLTLALVTNNTVKTKAASSSMSVKAYQNKIVITLKNITRSGTIYGYKANSYMENDKHTGISDKDSSDFTVGKYNPDNDENTFTVDRYDEDGYDRLYDKYYLASSDDDIIKGPVYATSISSKEITSEDDKTNDTTESDNSTATATNTTSSNTSLNNATSDKTGSTNSTMTMSNDNVSNNSVTTDSSLNNAITSDSTDTKKTNKSTSEENSININNVKFDQKSKKGLFNENMTSLKYAKDLGVSSITVNLDIGELMYDDTHPSNAIKFESNGKTYYFNKNVVAYDDSLIIPASTKKMNVIAVVAPWAGASTDVYPNSMRYPGKKGGILGTNTSTTEGLARYTAIMEFLAQRYSRDAKTGLISTYVIGNEVDFTNNFYNCNKLDTFMVEYERTLRISNLAVKKYAKNANVAISLTHYWNGDEKKLGRENRNAYSLRPYQMLNWLASFTNKQGAYDWAIAPHCYGTMTTTSRMTYIDSKMNWMSNNYKTSKQITFTNLDVLQAYLSQKSKRYNGKIRSVYLTESGVGSGKKQTKKQLASQAANLAFSYIKVANLSCIKSYNYYRLKDHKSEKKHKFTPGLITTSGKKKPSYNVYKYCDTASFGNVSRKYLSSLSFYKNGNKKQLISYSNGKLHSYFNALSVYTNRYKIAYSSWNCLKTSEKKYDAGVPTNIRARNRGTNATVRWADSKASGFRIFVNGKVVGKTTKKSYRCYRLRRYKKDSITVQAYKKKNGKYYYGHVAVVRV